MEAIDIALDVIDTRSFSNIWYWIGLAVLWSVASHWVIGVPYDLIARARRRGGEAEAELAMLARLHALRLLNAVEKAPVLMVGLAAFWLSGLTVLAFVYGIEFAQALFFLTVPMGLVIWHGARTARVIVEVPTGGEGLYRSLMRHRRLTQVVGMLTVTVTALFGMYQNLNMSVLN